MNKKRLMASGTLLAVGAILPISAGALVHAQPVASAHAETVATATSSATASQPAAKATDAPKATASPIVNTCEAKGMLMAEDGSCVPSSFYADGPATSATPTAEACPPGIRWMSEKGCADDPASVPAAPVTSPAPVISEDDPRWNCLTDGNKICGPQPELMNDAWASFDGANVSQAVGSALAFRASYVGTSGSSTLPGYWVVASKQEPSIFHVFKIDVG